MSDIGTMVAELIAAGCSPDVAAEVVARAYVAGVSSSKSTGIPPDSAAEKRRAYDRERKRKSTGIPPDSTGTPVSPIDTKIKISKRQNSDRPSRGSRIAPDWSPSEADRLLAKQEGFSDSEINREALRFRDYWMGRAGSGGVKLDWAATWRNWIRTSGEKLGKTPIAGVSSGSGDASFEAKFGSPELDAWDAYAVRTKGKSLPRNRDGGWRVPTRWPPGYEPQPTVDPPPAPNLRTMQ